MNTVRFNGESEQRLLRVSEAAAMLGVSQRTIWRMIADGQLIAVHIRGCTRVLRAEAMRILSENVEASCV